MKIRELIRLRNRIIKAKSKIEQMNVKYPDIYYHELMRIGNKVVNEWYKSYSPIVYHRQYSLYDAFKVSLNGHNYRVDFDSRFISSYHHHQDNDYIYNLVFEQGYHGGDTVGDNHPSPGTPWWRTPAPQFTAWGRPALKSFSPYSKMIYLMNKKIREIDKQKQDEFNKIIAPIQSAIDKL